jgi:hypothetical protein
MSILERNAVAHYGVQRNGAMRPLCLSWRSTWNWTREPEKVTCPHCRAALDTRDDAEAGQALAAPPLAAPTSLASVRKAAPAPAVPGGEGTDR